jgi:hypothetical protein
MTKRISGGFDLRMRVDLQEEDPRQVDQYLMPHNRNPICADPSIWLRTDEVADLLMKESVSYPLGLPINLDELLARLHERGIATINQSPVSLTIAEQTAMVFCRDFGLDYFRDAPSDEHLRSCGWRFLGFDTVELNGLTSGLKGIGYKEPSWSQLRTKFGGALNEVGLFSDEAAAAQFAEMRGAEIPSHAPFEVVGIRVHDPIGQ